MNTSSDALTIRPMQVEDVEQVYAIDQHAFPRPWPKSSYLFEVEKNPAGHPYVAEVLEDEGQRKVVGMIVVWLLGDEAHIATLAVDQSYRRQGIACRLLEYALDESIRAGATHASLEVRESNHAAQALYRRFGFGVVGQRKRYYQDNFEDALLMSVHDLDAAWAAVLNCVEE